MACVLCGIDAPLNAHGICQTCQEQSKKELEASDQNEQEQHRQKELEKIFEAEELTDLGNARRLAAAHGHELRYCHTRDEWFIWDTHRWALDDTGEIHRKAAQVIKRFEALLDQIAANSENLENYRRFKSDVWKGYEQGKRPGTFALQMQSQRSIEAMISLARNVPPIPVRRGDLDRDPWLLTVENGTLDLRTGDLRPHAQTDLCTMLAPVTYEPYASSTVWMKFLERVVPDLDVRLFIQEALGSSLTGCPPDHIFFLFGNTKTGKGTMLRAVSGVMGDYAHTARYQSFIQDKYDSGSQHREDLVAMAGKRFVVASEVQENKAMAEALIKGLTGRDTQRARTLHQKSFEFKPTMKIWIGTNFHLRVSAEDDAIWERLIQIPFEQFIPPDERDPALDEHLADEHAKSAILAWMVQGCLRWYDRGRVFAVPEVIKQTLQKYRDEMDPLKEFLDDACATSPTMWEMAGTLYGAYKDFAERRRERPVSQQRFGRILAKKGFASDKTATGRVWKGLQLKPEIEVTEQSGRIDSYKNEESDEK